MKEINSANKNTQNMRDYKQCFDWLLTDERDKPVCSFIPEVQGTVNVESSLGVKVLVRLKLYFTGGESKEVSVQLSGISQTDWFNIDHRCIINPNYRKANEYIANIIRAGINTAPSETQYCPDKMGIHHIDNTAFFMAGDRIISRSPKMAATQIIELVKHPFTLDIDTELSEREAFKGMRELISLSPEIGRVLLAHVISGITREAFKEAGLIPCAVLVIVGESGMLKSHYIPHIVQIYNRKDDIRAVTRFNSTQRYIEDILYEYSECTAVIDDLHSAEASSIKKRNEEKEKHIFRK